MLVPRPASRVALALAGALFALPAAFFVTAAVLKYELGVPFLWDRTEGLIKAMDSPVILLGGLGVAGLINLWPLLKVGLRRESGAIIGQVTLRPNPWNLTVAAVAGALVFTLVGYAIVENLGHLRVCREGGPCIFVPSQTSQQ